jgi:hypothetical protein
MLRCRHGVGAEIGRGIGDLGDAGVHAREHRCRVLSLTGERQRLASAGLIKRAPRLPAVSERDAQLALASIGQSAPGDLQPAGELADERRAEDRFAAVKRRAQRRLALTL